MKSKTHINYAHSLYNEMLMPRVMLEQACNTEESSQSRVTQPTAQTNQALPAYFMPELTPPVMRLLHRNRARSSTERLSTQISCEYLQKRSLSCMLLGHILGSFLRWRQRNCGQRSKTHPGSGCATPPSPLGATEKVSFTKRPRMQPGCRRQAGQFPRGHQELSQGSP